MRQTMCLTLFYALPLLLPLGIVTNLAERILKAFFQRNFRKWDYTDSNLAGAMDAPAKEDWDGHCNLSEV